MSARTTGRPKGRKKRRSVAPAREDDPRVVRSRAAVVEAARTLFLEKGYGGTTMEEIAALAGLTKRTVYNNYADKAALFTRIVSEVIAFAEEFARGLSAEFADDVTKADLSMALHDLGRRLALGILRPEVIALRRLLIGEARAFPGLARESFDRAPGRVIGALADGFDRLGRSGVLRAPDPRRAAEQFAYLIAGAALDRATLVGTTPTRDEVAAGARDGVETFLARFANEAPDRSTAGR
jgi:TetR/AcrR family transcriptional repressor of mexJK operon